MHAYLGVSHIEYDATYFQVNMYRLSLLMYGNLYFADILSCVSYLFQNAIASWQAKQTNNSLITALIVPPIPQITLQFNIFKFKE